MILIYAPIVILSILIGLTIAGKVTYGHGLGDLVYLPLPFILFIIYGSCLLFVKSSLFINVLAVIILLLSIAVVIKMTVRRGPEAIWGGPEIPFIKSSTKIGNEEMLRDFDLLMKKLPNDKERIKQMKEKFLEDIKKE